MKKIPTIFLRDFTNGAHSPATGQITREWHPDCLRIRDGEGVATYKWDGTSVMFRGGSYFKRYDAKRGKMPPPGFEPCGEPDEKTGHHPGWLPVDPNAPENKWHMEALGECGIMPDGTYELVGPKLQGNPHGSGAHIFHRHGEMIVSDFPRDYDAMAEWFRANGPLEGVVFWIDGQPVAKIKASDFGVRWK